VTLATPFRRFDAESIAVGLGAVKAGFAAEGQP